MNIATDEEILGRELDPWCGTIVVCVRKEWQSRRVTIDNTFL